MTPSESASLLTPAQVGRLKEYGDAVMRAPANLHLTAAKTPKEFWDRHIMDAVSLLGLADSTPPAGRLRVMDVGSGNGIPGVPFAICRPDWLIVTLDSDNKKCGFIDTLCKSNGILNVRALAARAEVAGRLESREKFDVVLARALSKLNIAIELAGPFVRIGGKLIVPHGTSWQQELEKSQTALREIGFEAPEVRPYKIPSGIEFTALIFKKDHETPVQYPRSIGTPQKKPL